MLLLSCRFVVKIIRICLFLLECNIWSNNVSLSSPSCGAAWLEVPPRRDCPGLAWEDIRSWSSKFLAFQRGRTILLATRNFRVSYLSSTLHLATFDLASAHPVLPGDPWEMHSSSRQSVSSVSSVLASLSFICSLTLHGSVYDHFLSVLRGFLPVMSHLLSGGVACQSSIWLRGMSGSRGIKAERQEKSTITVCVCVSAECKDAASPGKETDLLSTDGSLNIN